MDSSLATALDLLYQQAKDIKNRADTMERQLKGLLDGDGTPIWSTREELWGYLAHRHLAVIEHNGWITLAESLRIRQDVCGDKTAAMSAMFGKKGSGSMFYRDVPADAPPRQDDPVGINSIGMARAMAWRMR